MSKEEILNFLMGSVAGEVSVDEQVKFLEDFTPEKVCPEDLAVFAEFMIENMAVKLDMPGCIDICGTGGSGLERINTSTVASFILAELGIGIAKHGNKAASGRFGSFDLLEELGVDIEKGVEELKQMYRDKGLAFIYARNFHPVMKYFVEARKAIGKPTIFNILGPLLSPANAKKQIIGTGFKDQMMLIAKTCKLLGKERVTVVRGEDGLDEVTLCGKTEVVELKDGEIFEYMISPKDFGVEECDFEEIAGGDKETNKRIAMEILSGECKSRHADLVYVNCALALKLVGEVEDLKKGYRMAKGVTGLVKLESYKGDILKGIAASKILNLSDRSLYDALSGDGISVIAEIKKASPSEGQIFEGKFDAGEIARMYEEGGARAISVLTERKYFQGDLRYMKQAKDATASAPILCKDFIIFQYQIYQAREFGADAVLLIAALLDVDRIQKFLKIAESLGMDCLVEVHNEDELVDVLETDAKIIGINNRDLITFKTDLNITNKLAKMVPRDRILVSESGIKGHEDVQKLDDRVDAILVGTCLMKSKDITKKLHEIT